MGEIGDQGAMVMQ